MPLSVSELRAALAALSLDSRGNKDTLKKRWLRANKLPRGTSGSSDGAGAEEAQPRRGGQPDPAPRSRPPDQEYDSFLVFDVEATCERIDEPWGKLAFACVWLSAALQVPACNAKPDSLPLVLVRAGTRTRSSSGPSFSCSGKGGRPPTVNSPTPARKLGTSFRSTSTTPTSSQRGRRGSRPFAQS